MTQVAKTVKKPTHKSAEYFKSLDGFRGVFALLVAVHHAPWFSYFNYRTFVSEAFVIIDLFFAFSGFLMFRLYSGNITSMASAKDFMRRRFARLYPIHIFMLGVFIAFAVFRITVHAMGFGVTDAGEILPFHEGARDNWLGVFSNLFMTHGMGIHDDLTFNAPSWTISVEFFAYFLFAGMMIWMRPRKLIHFVGLAGIVAVLYYGLSRVKPNLDITYDYGFARCMAGFLTGLVAAYLYGRLKGTSENGKPFKNATLIEALTLIVCGIFVTYYTGSLQFLAAPFIVLFVVVFAFDGGAISRFMSQKIFLYLAAISYSVYMTHFIFAIVFTIAARLFLSDFITIGADGAGILGDLYLIPYLALVVGFSHLTWRYVEIPGAKFLRPRKRVKKPVPLAPVPVSR